VVRAATGTFHAPLKWKEPKRIFVCSLSDFFHPDILRIDRQDAIHVMRRAPQHTYLLLTKRPENVKQMLHGTAWGGSLPNNVWLGVTVENQEQADKRIPLLLEAQASTRFISCEPLLGAVDILGYVGSTWGKMNTGKYLHWCIGGGESGGKARPTHPSWARKLRDDCAAAGIPYMWKQWGEFRPYEEGVDHVDQQGWCTVPSGDLSVYPALMKRVGKHAAGRMLDGKLHDAMLVNQPNLNGVARSTYVCQEGK
jgi:protein gp37